jgi:hypothetical protein
MSVDVEDRVDDEKPWDCGPDCDCGEGGDGTGFPAFTDGDRESVAALIARISTSLQSVSQTERGGVWARLLGTLDDVTRLRAYLTTHSFGGSMAVAKVYAERAGHSLEDALLSTHEARLISERAPEESDRIIELESQAMDHVREASIFLLTVAANLIGA